MFLIVFKQVLFVANCPPHVASGHHAHVRAEVMVFVCSLFGNFHSMNVHGRVISELDCHMCRGSVVRTQRNSFTSGIGRRDSGPVFDSISRISASNFPVADSFCHGTTIKRAHNNFCLVWSCICCTNAINHALEESIRAALFTSPRCFNFLHPSPLPVALQISPDDGQMLEDFYRELFSRH
jgi:hypothetical protein